MTYEILDHLIRYWRKSFFTEPVLLATFILCFIVGTIYHHRQKERLFFLLYFLVGIILFCFNSPILFSHIYHGRKLAVVSEIGNTVFELTEFVAFYIFFTHIFRTKSFRRMARIFLIILSSTIAAFLLALFWPTYAIDTIRKHSLVINVIEFFSLAIMCLAYFYELFTAAPHINLFRRPSFFITSSTFFYSVSLIPFFLIANDMNKNRSSFYHILFACHFLLLTIVLLSLLKAFLWRKPITT